MPGRTPPPDADPEGDVAVIRGPLGHALFQPRWLRELSPDAREMCTELQEQVAIVTDMLEDIDATARDLREVAGLSWERLGWLLGLSGEGVRKRLAIADD